VILEELFWWDKLEITPEEEERVIRKVASVIHKYGMDAAAILFLESFKPLVYVGGELGKFFISPFLPALGEEISISGEKFFRIFEKRENIERLITILEEMSREEEFKTKEIREIEETKETEASEHEGKKRGWRRLIPFL